MLSRIRHVVIKEFIQLFRDRRMKAIVFVIPVIQLMVFGYAVTTDVTDISLAVFDLDKSAESRELFRRMESSGYFTVRYFAGSPEETQDLLDRGLVTVALQVNRGFSEAIRKGRPAEVQVLLDGTDSNTAQVAMDYAGRIIRKYGRDLAPQAAEQGQPRVALATRAWYNPELLSRNYNVPGVIAFVIMLTCLLLTSMAIVREREIGTMEQLMVTPIRPLELMLGKTIPFALIGFFDMIMITAAAILKFDIPIRGSFPLLCAATAIYLLSVLGMGLFISTVSRTQQQALMATFLLYIPAVLLSGFMFPINNMPHVIQYFTYLNPLRYFLVIVRGIFLKGNGVDILWPQMAALLLIGLGVMAVSSLRFRKRLG
ncbi:MAG: ABC transporter permease [Nitrospiraceae bacterium]|nr:ABC transporter permease [Nitrospiraceae bacterium]